jgi:hypothetical protein
VHFLNEHPYLARYMIQQDSHQHLYGILIRASRLDYGALNIYRFNLCELSIIHKVCGGEIPLRIDDQLLNRIANASTVLNND